MKCRHCQTEVSQRFIDLGTSPISNAYLTKAALAMPEAYYPLRVLVCTSCWLVQTEDFTRVEELFNADYAYFSSVSETWLRHAAQYVAGISSRLGLGSNSFVVELAANDGYLLKNFVAAGVPCLGIEPTASTAQAAEAHGIPIIREFFGRKLAEQIVDSHGQADLIIGNNVFAHVPDINDFTAGMKTALKSEGTITLEFPHLMRLIESNQFDTIYHEHFSYLSLHAVSHIFSSVGLRVFDADELRTHGGSLRIYGCHYDDARQSSPQLLELLQEEKRRGMLEISVYENFQPRVERAKDEFLSFLIEKKRHAKRVIAYGAAAKGNTLLNFAGIKRDLIEFVCDAAPSKQGKFLPGSRIPIFEPDAMNRARPDFVIILPWNIADEVTRLHSYIQEWGGKFIVAIPDLKVV